MKIGRDAEDLDVPVHGDESHDRLVTGAEMRSDRWAESVVALSGWHPKLS